MSIEYITRRLSTDHDVDGFDCGKPELNDWLKRHGRIACESGIARVYVWTRPHEAQVVAYFALTPCQVSRDVDGVPRNFTGGASIIPGYLIARLAVDSQHQGGGIGGNLLLNALECALGAAEVGGGRLVVVDALDDDAHAFYLKHGFRPVTKTPRRLIMKMKTVKQILNVP